MVYACTKQKVSNGNTRVEFHETVHDDTAPTIDEEQQNRRSHARVPCGNGIFRLPPREEVEMFLARAFFPGIVHDMDRGVLLNTRQ